MLLAAIVLVFARNSPSLLQYIVSYGGKRGRPPTTYNSLFHGRLDHKGNMVTFIARMLVESVVFIGSARCVGAASLYTLDFLHRRTAGEPGRRTVVADRIAGNHRHHSVSHPCIIMFVGFNVLTRPFIHH